MAPSGTGAGGEGTAQLVMAFSATLELMGGELRGSEESHGEDGALGRKWEEAVEREGAVCLSAG